MADQNEELREKARTIKCPRCGAEPHMACVGFNGQILRARHVERLNAVAGAPTKENREHWGHRQFQQWRADPTITIKKADDEAA